MNWTEDHSGGLYLTVPIELWEGMDGEYKISIARRPSYCDRGDWMIYVDGHNDLDYCDGFPRYFFGDKEQVKQQMEIWINRREAYHKHKRRSLNT